MLGAGQTGRRELGTDMLKMHCRKLSKNKFFFKKNFKEPNLFPHILPPVFSQILASHGLFLEACSVNLL